MASDDPVSMPLDELAGRAGQLRVAVVGGGMAGLVAAWECAKVGLRVTVFEAGDRLGGTVQTVLLDHVRVDVGADGFATRGGAVAGLVAEVGLTDALVTPHDTARRVWGVPGVGGSVPLPAEALLGIPENMWSDAARRILGAAGTWRAYVDRLRPPLTIGHERSLGRLVRSRMGEKVLRRLVAPVTAGVFFADPDDIDVDVAAPGLNAALTRAGSLSGAVGVLRGREAASMPAIQSVAGGMSRLVDAVSRRLDTLGADIRCDSPVSALERSGMHGWIVHTRGDEFDVTDEAPVRFDGVIVAIGETEARRLLADVAPDVASRGASAPAETIVHTVTLSVDARALDGHPPGAEVVAMPGAGHASSVLHVDARWDGVSGAADVGAADRHIVRVTFASPAVRPHASPAGPASEPPSAGRAAAGLSDAEATRQALVEASVLLGVDLSPTSVRAAHRATFVAAPPRAIIGRQAEADRLRAAIAAVPRLSATGAWLSGSGLAQVVPDAVAAAEALRRQVLFGDPAPS